MRQAPIALTALIVVVLGGALYFVVRSAPNEGPVTRDVASAAKPNSELQVPTIADTAAVAETEEGPRDVRATVAAGREVPPSWDASSTRWLEGQVVLPSGTPGDEEPRVLAFARAVEQGAIGWVQADAGSSAEIPDLLAQAVAEANGDFRIGLPPTGDVWLVVLGRFVHSRNATRIPGPSSSPGEDLEGVRLWPILGSQLAGRVLLPTGFSGTVEERFAVELGIAGGDAANQIDGSSFELRSVEVDEENRFLFDAVPIDTAVRLMVRPERFAAAREGPITPLAGRTVEIDLRLRRGAHLAGRVVDGAGKPVAEALVAVVHGSNFLAGRVGDRVRTAPTDAEGRFVLTEVRAGRASLRATKTGHLEASKKLELRAGERQTDLELVLTTGRAIEGQVQWPAGEPVPGAAVQAVFDMSVVGGIGGLNAVRGVEGSSTCDETGRFRIAGLGPGPFTVVASAAPPDSPTAVSEEEEEQEPDVLARWSARTAGVKPDGDPLTLVLEEPLYLRGRVIDTEGSAVPNFTVRAFSVGQELVQGMGSEGRTKTFDDGSGCFALPGMRTGDWELSVEARGFGPSEPLLVRVPQPAEEAPTIVLEAEAQVAGIVVNPEGDPVAGARVLPHVEALRVMALALHGIEPNQAHTDESGRFTLSGLAAGTLTLVAKADAYASSDPLVLELVAGEEREDLVLRLTRGASLTGEAFGKEGQPVVGYPVVAQQTNTMDFLQAETDARARFALPNLKPGTWQVSLMPDEDTLADIMTGNGAMGRLLANMRMQIVELAEGETKHVVFGQPPADAVRVFGQVTLDGEPYADAIVNFLGREAQNDVFQFIGCDDEGRYEIQLEKAGDYLMVVQRMGEVMAENSLELRQTIPEEPEVEIDVELPLGKISGLVTDENKNPLPGARVMLRNANSERGGLFWGGHYAELKTDRNGRYVADWLRPDDYYVAAGGDALGGVFGNPSPHGRITSERISLGEGEHREDLDFRLSIGGVIEGTVVDNGGRPVAQAAIFVRDEAGNVQERVSWVQTDAGGSFRVPSLAPASYTVSARQGNLASPQSALVRVRPGEEANVRLVLDPGTVLAVQTVDGNGQPLSVNMRITNEAGFEEAGVFSFSELMRALQQGGLSDLLHRVGPLVPGSYTIEATSESGLRAKERVTLRGEPEKKVTLVLR